MRSWVGGLLRRWADRIDHAGAPKSFGMTFTFERGRGVVLHGEPGVTSTDRRGCLLWYLNDEEHEKAWTEAEDRPVRVLWENLVEGRRPFVEHPPAHGQKLNPAGVAAIPVVTSSTPPSPPPPPSGVGCARGGVIRGPSDPSDDSITYKLSDGHGWVRPMTVEAFGEEGLKRLLGVDHIHPLVACPHCGTEPAALVRETYDARLFGCHACNETWALSSGERS